MKVVTNTKFTYYYFNNEKYAREKTIADKLGTEIKTNQVFVNGTWKDYTNTSEIEVNNDDNILITKGINLKTRTNL